MSLLRVLACQAAHMLGTASRSKHHDVRNAGAPLSGDHAEPRWLDCLHARGEQPLPGAHLVSPRRGYCHHGIYVGDDRVVHYPALLGGLLGRPVEEVSLAKFARGRRIWSRWTDCGEVDRQEVIRRARSRLGENQYRLLYNNCEHFCEWCRHGRSRSYQVERLFSRCGLLSRILARLAAGGGRPGPTRGRYAVESEQSAAR